MPTMSRAAVLAIPALVPVQSRLFGTRRCAVPVGSAPGEAVERADQKVDRGLGEARSHRACKSGDIAARRGRRFGRFAERARPGKGVQRFLLQFFGLELDRLDLVAQRFLFGGIDKGLGAFELAARIADRNDRKLAPTLDRGIELFYFLGRQSLPLR